MNDLKQAFYFLVRHIPFWAIPLGLVCAELALLNKLKERKKKFYRCLGVGFIFLAILIFYYWQGGPQASVEFFTRP